MDSLLEVRCQRLSGPARELERRRHGFSASTNAATAVRVQWRGSARRFDDNDGDIVDPARRQRRLDERIRRVFRPGEEEPGDAGIVHHVGEPVGAKEDEVDILPSDSRDQRIERYRMRSEEHTSELQSLMRISYAVFCLKKKKKEQNTYDK